MADRPPISRIVHLLGGLRAVDAGTGHVYVQAHADKRFIYFPSPPYAELYSSLKKLGFPVVGVEFVERVSHAAPDWWFSPPAGQFRLMAESRAWSEMRHLARTERRSDIVDISRRCAVLLELLGIRILQMSNAYNGAYLAQAGDGLLKAGHLFDNTYVAHIEAAIHAFLTDATNLRDLIFEFVWRFIFNEKTDSWSFKKIRLRSGEADEPVGKELVDAGTAGWLKRLTDLRNDVVHVAPIGAHHSFPLCSTRIISLPDGGVIPSLSYGLVDRDQSNMDEASLVRDNEVDIRRDISIHRSRLDNSEDALMYAWTTLGKLIALCERIRITSGIKGEMVTIRSEDIVSFTVRSADQ